MVERSMIYCFVVEEVAYYVEGRLERAAPVLRPAEMHGSLLAH